VVPEAIRTLTALTELELSGNQLNDTAKRLDSADPEAEPEAEPG